MAQILSGGPAAAAINEETSKRTAALRESGTEPCLLVMRVGAKGPDLAYEASLKRAAEAVDVTVRVREFRENVPEDELISAIQDANTDDSVHGILLFRPLSGLDEMRIIEQIAPEKDMDGVTDASMTGVFTGKPIGYPPCTADAVMRMIDFYNIPLTGARAVVVGRSLVVGKPLSMMLLKKNATVTVCHTKTSDMKEITQQADVLVAAAGHIGTIGAEHVREGQHVLDVGINFTADGTMCGDVLYDEVEPIVAGVSPVPNGVGSVTSAVLMSHVADAAEAASRKEK